MVPLGLGSKKELEELVEVRDPRVGEVMVTLFPLILTTPVKSSMSSSWLEPRLAFWRGRVKALKTAGFGAAGLKFTDNVPPEREMAFFKLKSSPMPCLPEEAATKLKEAMVGLPTAVRVALHTRPLAQLV